MDIEKVIADLKEYMQMVLRVEKATGVWGEKHFIYSSPCMEEVVDVTGFCKRNSQIVLDVLIRDADDWQRYRAKEVIFTEGLLTEKRVEDLAGQNSQFMLWKRTKDREARAELERETYEKLKAKYEPLAEQMAAAIKEVWRGVVDLSPWVEQNEVLLGNEVLADATKDTLKDVFERELHKRAIYLENK